MSTGSKKKRRIDRVTSVELPPGVLGNLWGHLRRGHVLVRLAMCAHHGAAAVGDHARLGAAAAVSFGRRSAARYRGPHRSSNARIPRQPKRPANQARRLAIATYDHDPAQLDQLRAKLENEVTEIVAAKSLAEVDELWDTSGCRWPKARRKPTAAGARATVPEVSRALAAEGALESSRPRSPRRLRRSSRRA